MNAITAPAPNRKQRIRQYRLKACHASRMSEIGHRELCADSTTDGMMPIIQATVRANSAHVPRKDGATALNRPSPPTNHHIPAVFRTTRRTIT